MRTQWKSDRRQFLHQRVREMSVSVVLLVAEAALLAVAGFWWWPAAVAAFVPLFVLGRAASVGGRLDSVRLQRGIVGEERVASLLDGLQPKGFRVIHDLEFGRGNADHVLVGPTGVFVIETKDWGGRFYRRRGRLMFNQRAADDVVGQVTVAALAVRSRLESAGWTSGCARWSPRRARRSPAARSTWVTCPPSRPTTFRRRPRPRGDHDLRRRRESRRRDS